LTKLVSEAAEFGEDIWLVNGDHLMTQAELDAILAMFEEEE
jgi:hypothetical protein